MKRLLNGRSLLASSIIAYTLVAVPVSMGAPTQAANASWAIDLNAAQRFMGQTYSAQRASVTELWYAMIENLKDSPDEVKIRVVNDFFHQHITYRTDQAVHGTEDFWTTPLETIGQGVGDCEDYAIAKYITLRLAGMDMNKLRLIYVRAQIGGPRSSASQAHMVLGYYATPDSQPLILDSLVRGIQPASERTDLSPVFSFNSDVLWSGTSGARSNASPTSRLSRWQNVIQRMRQQGIYLEQSQ